MIHTYYKNKAYTVLTTTLKNTSLYKHRQTHCKVEKRHIHPFIIATVLDALVSNVFCPLDG